MNLASYQNMDAHFGHSSATTLQGSVADFGYDMTFQDHTPSLMQHITATGDFVMPTAQRPVEFLSNHSSTRAVPYARRPSLNSMAASSIHRPLSAYSSYYNSSAAISPILSTHDYYTQSQGPFSPNSSDIFDLGVGDSNAASSPLGSSDEETSDSLPPTGEYTTDASNGPRSHYLYNAVPSEDGLYHCPYAATENCGHEPKQLKCEYDKHIDSHIKPFKCKQSKCRDLQFSSTACLLRHEREAHRMHGHAESLCEYPPCSRSVPGNGFRRSYNCKDHMTRCHDWVDAGPVDSKNRRSTQTSGSGKVNGISKVKNKALSRKQQIQKLRHEWYDHNSAMEALVRGLATEGPGPLTEMRMAQIQAEMRTIAVITEAIAKLERRAGNSG